MENCIGHIGTNNNDDQWASFPGICLQRLRWTAWSNGKSAMIHLSLTQGGGFIQSTSKQTHGETANAFCRSRLQTRIAGASHQIDQRPRSADNWGLDRTNPGLLRTCQFLTMFVWKRALATDWRTFCQSQSLFNPVSYMVPSRLFVAFIGVGAAWWLHDRLLLAWKASLCAVRPKNRIHYKKSSPMCGYYSSYYYYHYYCYYHHYYCHYYNYYYYYHYYYYYYYFIIIIIIVIVMIIITITIIIIAILYCYYYCYYTIVVIIIGVIISIIIVIIFITIISVIVRPYLGTQAVSARGRGGPRLVFHSLTWFWSMTVFSTTAPNHPFYGFNVCLLHSFRLAHFELSSGVETESISTHRLCTCVHKLFLIYFFPQLWCLGIAVSQYPGTMLRKQL